MSALASLARPLVLCGDERLRRVCREVAPDEDVGSLIAELLHTMQKADGMGLAAPQVGDGRRILVCRKTHDCTAPLVMINPVIEAFEGPPVSCKEGCLSFPGLFLTISRPRTIRVRYRDRKGRVQTLQDSSMLARIVQHEVDHCDGVLFSDHLPRWRRYLLSWRLRWLNHMQCKARERAA